MYSRASLTEVAAWVIRQDPRLLGIPSVRPVLIEAAVKIGLGHLDMLDAEDIAFTHTDNVPAVLDALREAVAAVRRAKQQPPLPAA